MTHRWAFILMSIMIAVSLLLISLPGSQGAQDPGNPFQQILNLLNSFGDVWHSWSTALPAAQRFVVLAAFNNAAVLDKNTGLVWEKSPGDTDNDGDVGSSDRLDWEHARFHCANKNVGGQKGWRLPAFDELASLVDPNPGSSPVLPAGHPFTNVQRSSYWSATTNADNHTGAWEVFFNIGVVSPAAKTLVDFVWCVRGDMNADQY